MADYIVINGIRIASDFEPETFGRLTTIGPRFMVGRRSYQVCQCNCGAIKVIATSSLMSGYTVSCGCQRNETNSKRLTRHGKVRTSVYRAWQHMKGRCYDKNDVMYPCYGGRGIKVCDRWLEPDGRGFINFLEDMGQKPSPKHSIDRIDNDGNYEPDNCRWATLSEQARNKTTNRYVTAFGQTRPLVELVEQYSLPYSIVFYRIQDGWSPEDALTKPLGSRRDKKNP